MISILFLFVFINVLECLTKNTEAYYVGTRSGSRPEFRWCFFIGWEGVPGHPCKGPALAENFVKRLDFKP